jgi:hypothetical protein
VSAACTWTFLTVIFYLCSNTNEQPTIPSELSTPTPFTLLWTGFMTDCVTFPTTLHEREILVYSQTSFSAELLYTMNKASATTTLSFIFATLPVTRFKPGDIVALVYLNFGEIN